MLKIITMITKFILIALTVLLFASTSPTKKAITGSGHVTTENRTVQGEFVN
jgi:hypothetical protein